MTWIEKNEMAKKKISEDALNWLCVGISLVCMAFMARLMYVVVAGKDTLW